MKRYSLVILVFLLSHQLYSQLIKKDNNCIGFGELVLGQARSNYTVTELEGGKYSKNNHEFTICGYSGQPIEIMGISFNSTILIFNDSNKLVSCTFVKFYKKKDNPKYEKAARKDYQQIIKYVTEQLNSEGKNKTYYASSKIVDKGQEWSSTSSLLKIKKLWSAYNSYIELSVGTPGL